MRPIERIRLRRRMAGIVLAIQFHDKGRDAKDIQRELNCTSSHAQNLVFVVESAKKRNILR